MMTDRSIRIVPVRVGEEALARLVSRYLPGLGVIANLVEYPAVAKGDARLNDCYIHAKICE